MQHEEWVDLNGNYCKHSLDTDSIPQEILDKINEDKVDEYLYDFHYETVRHFVFTYTKFINPEFLSQGYEKVKYDDEE